MTKEITTDIEHIKSVTKLAEYLFKNMKCLMTTEILPEKCLNWAEMIIKYLPNVTVEEMDYCMELYFKGKLKWNNFLGVQQIIQPISEKREEIENYKKMFGK